MNYWSFLLDKFKYLSMEARFYLVFSLFSACPMDRYGVRCNETCPLCKNLGVCHPKNGSCICSPGFYGPLCDKSESFDIDLYDCYSIIHVQFIYTFVVINMSLTCMYCFMKKYFLLSLSVCPDGYYGYKCSAKCSCENGANCSKSDGRCDCPPGYIGASCSQSKLQTPLLIFFM